MEWLSNPIVHGLIGGFGIPIAVYMLTALMPRSWVYNVGFRFFKVIRLFIYKKAQKPTTPIAVWIEATIEDFLTGALDATKGNPSKPPADK